MKILKILLTMLALCLSQATYSQEKNTDTTKVKKDNFLDMGAEMLTQTFGTNLDGNTTGEKTGFLDMMNTMDITEEQKTEYRNQYYLQAKELTQKQKDSLGKAIEKRILEANNTDD